MYELVVLDLDKCCMLHHATCSYTVSCANAFPHEGDVQSSRVQDFTPRTWIMPSVIIFISKDIFYRRLYRSINIYFFSKGGHINAYREAQNLKVVVYLKDQYQTSAD